MCLFDSLLFPTLDYKFMRIGTMTRFPFSVFLKKSLLPFQHLAYCMTHRSHSINIVCIVCERGYFYFTLFTFENPSVYHFSLTTLIIPSQSDHESSTLWHSPFLLSSNSLTVIILLRFPSACSLLSLLLALLQ